jgi:hypothetical protein
MAQMGKRIKMNTTGNLPNHAAMFDAAIFCLTFFSKA